MSMREKFRRAWSIRFPSVTPPELTCFDEGDPSASFRRGQSLPDGGPGSGSVKVDIAAVERNLQKSNELIAQLTKQLQQQEFISNFLWETVHAFYANSRGSQNESSTTGRPVKVSPLIISTPDETSTALDEPIPLQDALSVSFSPITDGNISGQNSPSIGSTDISLGISTNGPLMKQNSADSILNVKLPCAENNSGGTGKKSSLPLLDFSEEDSSVRTSIQEENRTYSLDSGKFLYSDVMEETKTSNFKRPAPQLPAFRQSRPEMPLPNPTSSHGDIQDVMLRGKKQKPVPAPRTSIRPKADLNVFEGECTSTFNAGRGVVPGNQEVAPGFGKEGHFQKKALRSFQSESRDSIFAVVNRRGHNSMKNLQLPPIPAEKSPTGSSPRSSDLQKPNLSDVSGQRTMANRPFEGGSHVGSKETTALRSGSDVVLRSTSDIGSTYDPGDYEEAMPVQRALIESNDASSDEDEPLYYNLMLLKQQTLSRVQTLYSKAADSSAQAGIQPPKVQAGAYRLGLLKETELGGTSLSSESVRSVGSDSVFEDRSTSNSWRKRRSMYCATDSVDSQSECDELDTVLPLCPENEKLQMRKWVVTSILESEHSYLNILDILMQYMQTFKNLLGTAQAVISSSEIDTIFSKIPDLLVSHKMFVHDLEPKVENWSAEQQIADTFRKLALAEYKVAPEYIKNYQKAVVTIHRCWQENAQFAMLTKEIQVKGMKEKPSLEELLHKPVFRFQRNTLVLHDLIKCTPTSHADYDTLQKTLQLAQNFLENLESTDSKDSPENQRYLAKQGLIVEKVENVRKLRHIFLFNDVLVCARQKISSKQKIHFEPKWYIPLIDLTLDDKVCIEEERLMADCQQQEIELLQKKVSELQCELKSEMKLCRGNGDAQRQWSFHNRSRSLEKIKKKLMEQQGAMIKASPRLLFRVHNRRTNRQFTLLMASDYERSNWRFTIAGLLSRAQGAINLSSTDLQNLLNSQKLPKISTLAALIGSEDISLEEEHLFGNLNITIYRLQGLKQPLDAYCAVEVDSFGHFFVKAKTNIVANSMEPVWNEDFEIDMEGAQTIRILCYKMNRDAGSLIGTCALELSKAWLRGEFQEKIVSLNDEISVTISLRYCSREETLKRTLSSVKGGMFGAKLRTVTKREGSNIPLVICTCVEEVDRRGMTEVGIYRVSGVQGEIQRLRKAFEKNTKAAIQLVKEVDINVVTSLMKLYLRELPEALYTDALYTSFIKGMGLSDPEAKEKYIQSVVDSLPEPNHSTVLYLNDHLLRVAFNETENKMTLQNLATVFGPTLLRPAAKEGQQQTLEELFSTGTRDAMMQTNILLYILNIRRNNASTL